MSDKRERFPTGFSMACSVRNELRVSKPRLTKRTLADSWRQAVVWISVLSIYAVSLYPALVILDDHPATPLLTALIAPVLSGICVLVHEIGHAVAAWLVGWRVHLIVIGNLGFAPRQRGFIRISDHRHQQDFGGWVHATPPDGSAWDTGLVPFILGGAAGNLLLGVLSMLSAMAMHDLDVRLSAVLTGLGGVSLVFAVANLVPFSKPGIWENDGAAVIRAFRGDGPAVRDQRIARLIGMVYDGVSVEDWDVSALNDLIDRYASEPEIIDPLLLSYAFGMADLAMAKTILERLLKANPDGAFEEQCMYAFVISMVDRDALRASTILEKLPRKRAKKSFSFWRAQAVTAQVLEKRDEALEAVRNARRIAERSGARPDDDDEAVFRAIEQGRALPRFEPRGRLSFNGED